MFSPRNSLKVQLIPVRVRLTGLAHPQHGWRVALALNGLISLRPKARY